MAVALLKTAKTAPQGSQNRADKGHETRQLRAQRTQDLERQREEALSHPVLQTYDQPHAFMTVITPVVAMLLLERMEHNRPRKRQVVVNYAEAMREGRWKENGETIKVATTGEPIDGQHRLDACFESGLDLHTAVAVGLHPDSYRTIDIGLRRSIGVTLRIMGYTYPAALAATANHLARFEAGVLASRDLVLDADQMVDRLQRHPTLHDSVKFAYQANKVAAASTLACAHFLFKQKDRRLADRFIVCVARSDEGRKGEPFYELREKLTWRADSRGRFFTYELFFFYWQAWNATRVGERMTRADFRLPQRVPSGAYEPLPDLL